MNNWVILYKVIPLNSILNHTRFRSLFSASCFFHLLVTLIYFNISIINQYIFSPSYLVISRYNIG